MENIYMCETYRNYLDETISIIYKELWNSDWEVWNSIYTQLLDIKENVVQRRIITDDFDIDERYSIGVIAQRYFEEGSEMQERLYNVFAGAFEYNENIQ